MDAPTNDGTGAESSAGRGRDELTASTLRATLVRNTLANGLSYAVVVLSAVILTPLVIHRFGAAVYGVWILINQVTGYAGMLDVGVQPAVSKRVAEARTTGADAPFRDFIVSAFWLHGVVAALTFVLGLGLAIVFPSWFRLGDVPVASARTAVVIIGLTTALGFPAGVVTAILKGALRFDLVSWIGIAAQGMRVVGLVVALQWHAGVVGLALSGLVSAAVTLLAGAVAARRILGPRYLARGRASWAHIRSIGHFGVFTFISVAGWYLSYATDAAIIGAVLTVSDVAHFGLAVNVLVILSGVVGAFSGTLMPVAAQLETGGRRSDTQDTYLVGTRVCLTLMIPATGVLFVAGSNLLSIWVGRDFGAAAGAILRVLCVAHFAVIVNGPGFHMGVGMGLNRPIALWSLAEGAVNVVLSYALARRIGVIGVAVGTLIPSVLAHGLILPNLVRSHIGIPLRRFIGHAVMPAVWPVFPAIAIGLVWWLIAIPIDDVHRIAWTMAMALTYAAVAGSVLLVRWRRAS